MIKIHEAFWSALKSNNRKTQLWAIYAVAIVFDVFLFVIFGVRIDVDTPGYVGVGGAFMMGEINSIRTPVYPLIIYGINYLVGDEFYFYVLAILQLSVFIASIYAFYSIGERLIKSKLILFFIVVTYACNPCTVLWSRAILTESFAISGMVLMLFFFIEFHEKFSIKHLMFVHLILLFLIMLRPVFIYLFPILLFFWVYSIFLKKEKKIMALGLAITLIIGLFFLGYCAAFQKQHGVFTHSFVPLYNQYVTLREAKIIKISDFNDIKLQNELKNAIQPFNECGILIDRMGATNINHLILKKTFDHFNDYLLKILKNIKMSMPANVFEGYAGPYKYAEVCFFLNNKISHFILLISFFILNFSFLKLYFLIILYPIFLIIYIAKKKQIPFISIFLFIFLFFNVFTVIVGTPHEYWPRTIAPSYPIIFLIIGQFIDNLNVKIKSKIILR